MTTATRAYQSYPETVVTTKYGPLLVVGNGGTTLCIRTDSRPGTRQLIEVRGGEYSINAHVEQDGDGWKIVGATSYEQRQYLHISRVDWKGEVSEPARKTITALVLEVAKQHGTPDLLRGGRLATISNEIGRLDGKIAEMEAELAKMQDERARLRAEEALILTVNE